MKKSTIHLCGVLATFTLISSFTSCQFDSQSKTSDSSQNATDLYTWGNSYQPASTVRSLSTLTDDYSSVDDTYTFSLELDGESVSVNGIELTAGAEAISVNEDDSLTALLASDGLITLTSSNKADLVVELSGNASSSRAIFISSNKNYSVLVKLNGVTINSGNYPVIEMDKKSTLYLYAASGTENNLTDGRSYGTGYSEAEGTDYYTSSYSGSTDGLALTASWAQGSDKKGSVYAKGPLILCGPGEINLTENYKHGFYSKDYIRVLDGEYTVTSTGRNAFQSLNAFLMSGGEITIEGNGTNTNNESRGIVVEGLDYDTDDNQANDYPGEGFIYISGGTITSTTVGKGLTAKWDIDEDAGSSGDTSDDPYPYVYITGEDTVINITTTGTPYDKDNNKYQDVMDADGVTENELVSLSPEGIEGKQAVFISGGTITVNATDDGINVSRDTDNYAGHLSISGGKLFIYSSANDAIDSNGTIEVSGGTIVSYTASNPECGFDADDNTLAFTGGLVAAIGTNNYTEPSESACANQGTIVLSGNYFGKGNTTMAVKDSSGSAVYAFTVPSAITSESSTYIMILTSPDFTADETYSVYKNVTASGGTSFNGLYTQLPSVSGGSSSVSDITFDDSLVYTKTSSSNGGAQEGLNGPGGH